MTHDAPRRLTATCVALALLVVGLAGCGDPTYDPDAPVVFGVGDGTGELVFCAPLEGSRLLVEIRPTDNSTAGSTLVDASGTLALGIGDAVKLDTLPNGTTGVVETVSEFAGSTIFVLAVIDDPDVQNLRAHFTIPESGLNPGSWINGRGEIAETPCANS
jgi:hypothetical protein